MGIVWKSGIFLALNLEFDVDEDIDSLLKILFRDLMDALTSVWKLNCIPGVFEKDLDLLFCTFEKHLLLIAFSLLWEKDLLFREIS